MTIKQIDLLLTNGTVLTMDSKRTIFRQGAVAIEDDHIVDVGEADELTARYQAAKIIDCTGCVISPGLINAHTHVPMTLLRGLSRTAFDSSLIKSSNAR